MFAIALFYIQFSYYEKDTDRGFSIFQDTCHKANPNKNLLYCKKKAYTLYFDQGSKPFKIINNTSISKE